MTCWWLERAVREERTLVTIDGDFGDWVVLPLSEHFWCHSDGSPPDFHRRECRQIVAPTLLARHSQEDFRNKLVIVSLKRVRWIHTKEELEHWAIKNCF